MPIMLRPRRPIGFDDDPDALPIIGEDAPVTSDEPSPVAMQPQPITANPIAAATPKVPIANPKFAADQAELTRLQKSGSGIDQLTHPVDAMGNPDTTKHPGFWKKLGSVAARIGDVAGSAFFPGIAEAIPGTTLHHEALVGQQQGRVANDLESEKEQATIANLKDPPDKSAQEGKTVETGDGVFQWNPDTSRYDIPVGKGKKKAGPVQHIATDQGFFKVNDDGTLEPMTYNGAPVKNPKAEKPDTPEQQYIDEFQRTHQGATVAQAISAYAAATQKPDRSSGDKVSARADKSYQYISGKLDKVGEPISTAIQRMGRLRDTLAQGTPQADALVAPELLTVMAGGAGSGLRMNEAEIARIVGGRSKWQNLKAAAQVWSLDPAKANSITPEQRQQIHALVEHVNQKLIGKQQILDDAREKLLSSDDPKEHRQIENDARKRLTQIDEGGATEATGGGGDFIYARDPQGTLHKAAKGSQLPSGWKLETPKEKGQ